MRRLSCIIFVACFLKVHSQNNLSLSSADGRVFKVFLSGRPHNEIWQAHCILENILKDTLSLEIEYENKKRFPLRIYFKEHGVTCSNKEFNYLLEYNDQKFNARFSGIYDVHTLSGPLVPSKPVIDTSKKYRNAVLEHFCEIKESKPFYFNNIPKENGCSQKMPSGYLNHVSLLIKKTELPDQRFTVVENVCRNNCLDVEQLGVLLNYIEYEIEKLKIVRLAYYHLVDTENKMRLEKNFRFETSINELRSFYKDAEANRRQRAKNCTGNASQMVIDNYCNKLAVFSNDGERLNAFKKGYSDLCYSTDQVGQILSKFVHDREKLQVAMDIYPYCTDKENFMRVADLFSYNQSISELKDYIDKQVR